MGSTGPGLAQQLQLRPVGFAQFPRNVEPQAGPLAMGGKERFEHLLPDGFGNAGPIILHMQLHHAAIAVGNA